MTNQITHSSIVFAIDSLLDYLEFEYFGEVSFHRKRVAYISLLIGLEIGYSKWDLYELGSYAMLHDIGAIQAAADLDYPNIPRMEIEHWKSHCTYGQAIIDHFPTLRAKQNVILYHHERFDGSGYFGIQGKDIPLMAQIIGIAEYLDIHFFAGSRKFTKEEILLHLDKYAGVYFDKHIVDAVVKNIQKPVFWLDILRININYALKRIFVLQDLPMRWKNVLELSGIMSAIIDSKSETTDMHSRALARKALKFAVYNNFPKFKTEQFVLAAYLHDIGKLIIPKNILNKGGALLVDEQEIIHEHPYYTEKAMTIMGVDPLVTSWAVNHHENLNGSGYPRGLPGEDLDFESRALCVLDIYQALTEKRLYREASSDEEAFHMLDGMADLGELDRDIVALVRKIFTSS